MLLCLVLQFWVYFYGYRNITMERRSILNKLPWLHRTPFSTADILVLQETFLTHDKTLTIPDKVIYRLGRLGRPGGGLFIEVNATWPSLQLNFDSLNLTNELLGIRVFRSPTPLNIINVYSSSGLVVDDLTKVTYGLPGDSLILGNFKLHHRLWGALVSSRGSDNFVDWLSSSPFCLLNLDTPTPFPMVPVP